VRWLVECVAWLERLIGLNLMRVRVVLESGKYSFTREREKEYEARSYDL